MARSMHGRRRSAVSTLAVGMAAALAFSLLGAVSALADEVEEAVPPASSAGLASDVGVVTVTLSAEAGSAELDYIEYQLDGGPWTRYLGPFDVTEAGYHSLVYRAVDAAGNVEDVNGQAVIVAAPMTAPNGANPSGIGNPFHEHNGIMQEYIRDPEGLFGFNYGVTPYADLTAKIEDGWYTDRGLHHIMIYGAWKATNDFLGLPALDFFDAQVGTGTVDDIKEFAETADEHDLNLIMYKVLIYMHHENPVFVKAAQDKANGIDLFESRIFRWDDRPQPQASCPSNAGLPGQNQWFRSPSIADNRCFVRAWGYPALDFERPEAVEFAKSVLAFWMDLGFQGFEFDAPQTYLGMNNNGPNEWRQTEIHVEFTSNHVHPDGTTKPKLLYAEGSGGYTQMAYNDRVGHNAVQIDTGVDTFPLPGRVGRTSNPMITVSQLEDHYVTWADSRRQNGRGTVVHSSFNGEDGNHSQMPGDLRALDWAVHAGAAGSLAISHYQSLHSTLPPDHDPLIHDVFRAMEKSTALAPGASRERIPTQGDLKGPYAVLRRSMDGSETALTVFNLSTSERCVTVNLAGSGVTVPQRPTDLATGEPGQWLRAEETTFKLGPRGWLFLDVAAGPGFGWTAIDSSDPGWTVGGWSTITDASAYGGSRIGGNVQNGFAEYTFEGTSVQGWGQKSTTSGQQVRVFIDGEPVGDHSQRRTTPTSGGTQFYGQQLFSLAGLEPGEHTIRIEQINPTAGNAGGTGIDYLLVSDEEYVVPATPAGGDRCAGDVTPPESTVTLTPEPGGGIYTEPTVTLAATDDSSGVATIEYELDGGGWTEYVAPFQVTEPGVRTLRYRSTDVAGNVEDAQILTFEVQAPCSASITGSHTGPLAVTSGVTCVEPGARVTGPVTVQPGAALRADGAIITGPTTATGAAEIRLCDTRVTGPINLTGSGTVRLGDPDIGCGPNTVTGPVTVTASTGPTVIAGNRIVGPLACTGNDPAPVNKGLPNTGAGPKSGQCRDL
jgi:Alpha amylase, catalytic domain